MKYTYIYICTYIITYLHGCTENRHGGLIKFFWQMAWLFCLLQNTRSNSGLCHSNVEGTTAGWSDEGPKYCRCRCWHLREKIKKHWERCLSWVQGKILKWTQTYTDLTNLFQLWKGQHATASHQNDHFVNFMAWTAAAAAAPAAMASSPVSPFATLSMDAILQSVNVCLWCHVATQPIFSSETLRWFDVHGWIHIVSV